MNGILSIFSHDFPTPGLRGHTVALTHASQAEESDFAGCFLEVVVLLCRHATWQGWGGYGRLRQCGGRGTAGLCAWWVWSCCMYAQWRRLSGRMHGIMTMEVRKGVEKRRWGEDSLSLLCSSWGSYMSLSDCSLSYTFVRYSIPIFDLPLVLHALLPGYH